MCLYFLDSKYKSNLGEFSKREEARSETSIRKHTFLRGGDSKGKSLADSDCVQGNPRTEAAGQMQQDPRRECEGPAKPGKTESKASARVLGPRS